MYILPQPEQTVWQQGTFHLRFDTEIVIDACISRIFSETECAFIYEYAKLLQQEITSDTGLVPPILRHKVQKAGARILLTPGKTAWKPENKEAYSLQVETDGVTIAAVTGAGILHGVQTLRQMIRQGGTVLPCVSIIDAPKIPYRGICYDVTRGRVPTLAELKKQADICSFYKINQFQLYVEHSYLFPNFSEVWRGNTPLTAEEIQELDSYCRKLHIELVPALASFGHLYDVLRTKAYGKLCELEDSDKEAYSLVGRMAHHTVDTSNEESFAMVAGRIKEFAGLFSSEYFNVCGDETFDLCKGRSKKIGEEQGVKRVYLDFLKKLCNFIIKMGKIPMYWGDVLLEKPELLPEMPSEAVCLNWEYWPQVTEEKVKILSDAGVKHLYLCPGVQNWNHLINKHSDAYQNIFRMCCNAHKFHAEGILNTQWGDLGHIAHPEFSTIGQIYGAAFSWSDEKPEEEEINRAISVLQYGDQKGELVSLFRDLADTECVNWWHAVQYKEEQQGFVKKPPEESVTRIIFAGSKEPVDEKQVEKLLADNTHLLERLYQKTAEVASEHRADVCAYILMGEGQRLLTMTGMALYQNENKKPLSCDPKKLAVSLECWLMEYQKLWRTVSKESELFRIADVICWYADRLREI